MTTRARASDLSLPRGLVGLEDMKRFRLVEDPETSPFSWLESLDEPSLSFVLVDVASVVGDYPAALAAGAARADLADEAAAPDDVRVLLSVQKHSGEASVNLLAPLAIDRGRGIAAQVVLHDTELPVRHVIGRVL